MHLQLLYFFLLLLDEENQLSLDVLQVSQDL